MIVDEVDRNFEVLDVRGIGLDVVRTGQHVVGSRQALGSGDSVQLVMRLRVSAGTEVSALDNQGSASFAGMTQPLLSTLIRIAVVPQRVSGAAPAAGKNPPAAAPGTPPVAGKSPPVASQGAAPAAGKNPPVTAQDAPATTAKPVPTGVSAAPPLAVAEQQVRNSDKLPATGGGVPLMGVVLLGLTMLVHSLRSHRTRVRI
ncbi:MAG: hypothetical protein NVS2B7_26030 [Herpetosiphon sp.]